MKKAAHTPGPWKVRFMNPKEPEESDFFVEAANNNKPELGYGIEILGDDYGTHCGYPREQRLADAQGISALPELLDVCKKLLEHYPVEHIQLYDSIFQQILLDCEKAVAKATPSTGATNIKTSQNEND